MVRNSASMQSLRSSMADCSMTSEPQPQQPQQQQQQQPPSPAQQQDEPYLQKLDGSAPAFQIMGNDPYTKSLMTKVATGQATPEEQAAFNRHVHQARSLPSIQNLLQPSSSDTASVQAATSSPPPSAAQFQVSGPKQPTVDDYQRQLALLEQQNLRRRMEEQRRSQPVPSMGPERQMWCMQQRVKNQEMPAETEEQDPEVWYQMERMLYLQKKKKEMMLAAKREEEEGTQKAQDWQQQQHEMRLMLIDQQRKKNSMMIAAREAEQKRTLLEQQKKEEQSTGDTQGSTALRDYQMQVKLLEQQNKKRLWVCRAEQEDPLTQQQQQQQQRELEISEQRNKTRLLTARQPHYDFMNEIELLDQRRRDMIMEEQIQMRHGTLESTWEENRTRLLDVHPGSMTRDEVTALKEMSKKYNEKTAAARRKSQGRGLAATLAANEEALRFKQATRVNAAKYTKPFCDFLTDNPTVFHCVDAMKRELLDAGWSQLSERESWDIKPSGSYFVERNGSSLIAFVVGAGYEPGNGAAILAGHVDALTAKLKPISQVPNKAGYLQLGVAPYAGGLGRTWWDRDLGIGGRVHIKEGDKIVTRLVKLDWPIAKIPTLAEHFGAPAGEAFINPNKETQMVPIIGLGGTESSTAGAFGSAEPFSQPPLLGGAYGPVGSFVNTQPPALVRAISNALGLGQSAAQIVNWELELFDVQPAAVAGLNKEFISAGRIDDKLCSWAAFKAILDSQANDTEHSSLIKVVGLFDDEEIGSLLRQGARGNFLPITLERAVGSLAGHHPTSDLMGRTYANSFLVSSDVTHAVNPNFLGQYLENHAPHLNVGVAVAADSNGHMTTDSVSTTILKRCADKVGAQLQVFQIRNDSRSGGTVGPMLSSALGIRSIDAGLAQLSMHSIRATCGALDPGLGVLMFIGFLNGFESVDKEMQD